jgi:hypothetical protein
LGFNLFFRLVLLDFAFGTERDIRLDCDYSFLYIFSP